MPIDRQQYRAFGPASNQSNKRALEIEQTAVVMQFSRRDKMAVCIS